MVSSKIIKGCIKNDRKCQKDLYATCAPYVYTIAKSYIRDEQYVRDALQESFSSIYGSLKNFDEAKGSLKSWIAKITTYRCIDFLKKNNKIKFDTNLEVVDYFSEDDFNYLNQLTRADIESLLHLMPQGYRTAFMLVAIDDYKHKEVGELLEITAETSRSQYHRALKWVKKNMSITKKKREL